MGFIANMDIDGKITSLDVKKGAILIVFYPKSGESVFKVILKLLKWHFRGYKK